MSAEIIVDVDMDLEALARAGAGICGAAARSSLAAIGGAVGLSAFLAGSAIAGAWALGSATINAIDRASERRRMRQEEEIAILAREINRLARALPTNKAVNLSEEMINKNREHIRKMLDGLEPDSLNIASISNSDQPSPPQESDLKERYLKLFNALAFIDAEVANSFRDAMEEMKSTPLFRQKILYENLEIEYGNALRKNAAYFWRAGKLNDLLPTLSGAEAAEFQGALKSNIPDGHRVEEETYNKLIKLYLEFLERDVRRKSAKILEQQILAKMKLLGYRPVTEISSDEPILFNTSERDYRIMARVDPATGRLALRLVRVVATEQEKRGVTTAQRRRDKEYEKKWCADVDRLLQSISEDTGLEFGELYRRESSEDHDVLVIVDPSSARKADKREANARN